MTIWTSIYNQIRLHFLMQGQSYEAYTVLWQYHHELLTVLKTGDEDRV